MKYPEIKWGTKKAIIDKFGGIKGIERFLRNELFITDSCDKPFSPFINEDCINYSEMTWGTMEAVINKIGGEENVAELLSGGLLIEAHTINCDINPRVDAGFQIDKHTSGGQLEWDFNKTGLHICKEQKNGVSNGHNIIKQLDKKLLANANILDCLLCNYSFIPKRFYKHRGKIFFGATIYSDVQSKLYVRCMEYTIPFGDDVWVESYERLDQVFDNKFAAAFIYEHDLSLLD